MNRWSPARVGAAGTALAVVLHGVLGWAWTILAGVLAGAWYPSRGYLLGAGCVGGAWTLFVVYTALRAPEAFRTLIGLIGAFSGNMPGAAVVAGTVGLGGLIGALGGGLGSGLAFLLRRMGGALSN